MPRILHFGLGNFHRAHQAIFTQHTNDLTDPDWSITGVSLRSAGVRDSLACQNFDYTLVVRGGAGTAYEKVSVIDDILVATQSPDKVIAAIADPEVQIISATVTEKGYHIRNSDSSLDVDDPVIVADLAGEPATFLGFLARGLRRRSDAKSGPVTILSCDNLNANGDTLAKALREFCALFDPELTKYLSSQVTFPNCMVDRITPATTQSLIDEVAAKSKFDDRNPVETEDYSEWVIEDNFAAAHPAWEQVGAELVEDVAPYELRKLRLLNGSHSYLAYAGTLKGYEFVHEAIADPELVTNVRALMDEATETLPAEIHSGTAAYADQLIQRFLNQALHHKLRQIAMDGTQKLPVRLMATIVARQAKGCSSPHALLAVASWMEFALSETRAGRPLQDPEADAIFEICNGAKSPTDLIAGLLGILGTEQSEITLPDDFAAKLQSYFD